MQKLLLKTTMFFWSVTLLSCGAEKNYTDQIPPPPSKQESEDDLIDDNGVGTVFGKYKIYFGSTHAHTFYSDHILDTLGANALNSPQEQLRLAIESGYDFYCITDHSHEDYNGEFFCAKTWNNTALLTTQFTNKNFVALRGYEYSENSSAEGAGHINVFNSSDYLCAHRPGADLALFYNWLSSSHNNDVAASFNHPMVDASDSFRGATAQTIARMTMYEVINGEARDKTTALATPNNNIWIAWSEGWQVSPVAGCDNHGVWGISRWKCRTGIAATSLTPKAIMNAMRNRRTYASYDINLSAFYSVNDYPMGSVITRPSSARFEIHYDDPDTNITKIEIWDNNKAVVKSQTFGQKSGVWRVVIESPKATFYVVRIYSAVDGQGENPTAFMSPVWMK